MTIETLDRLEELDEEFVSAGLGQIALLGDVQTAMLEVVFDQDNQATLVG